MIIANYTNSQLKLLPEGLQMTSVIRGALTCVHCENINCNYCFGSSIGVGSISDSLFSKDSGIDESMLQMKALL